MLSIHISIWRCCHYSQAQSNQVMLSTFLFGMIMKETKTNNGRVRNGLPGGWDSFCQGLQKYDRYNLITYSVPCTSRSEGAILPRSQRLTSSRSRLISSSNFFISASYLASSWFTEDRVEGPETLRGRSEGDWWRIAHDGCWCSGTDSKTSSSDWEPFSSCSLYLWNMNRAWYTTSALNTLYVLGNGEFHLLSDRPIDFLIAVTSEEHSSQLRPSPSRQYLTLSYE